MAHSVTAITPNATGPDCIDIHSDVALDEWAKRLNVSVAQPKEAVGIVGNRASYVQAHLKGSRSATNADREADEMVSGASSPTT